MVTENIRGKFSGYIKMLVSGGTYDPNGQCVRDPNDGNCHSDGFIAGFFGGSATSSCDTNGYCPFNFVYDSSNPNLTFNHWVNSSAGNSGDIATS
jgi:hypothetical protein